MATIAYYTEEGLQKLKDELHQLRTVERKLIIKAIADARDKGDLSENAEYDAAKSDQGLLEIKISKLEEIVSNARIVDTSKLDITKVSILTTVKIKNLKNNMEMKYTLVAENEADLKAGKISIDSPIGKALVGRGVGDKVDVTVPAGVIPFEIIEITI
ncbi:MAG: transcription elongation factor GreA [Bacteroidetes bacterium]|jgi:transcription elongation factor GreA|nr:transcription elongation factor GreA [Bacteroidota bacterium]